MSTDTFQILGQRPAADLFADAPAEGPVDRRSEFPPDLTEQELKVYCRVVGWRMQWHDAFVPDTPSGDALWAEYAAACTALLQRG